MVYIRHHIDVFSRPAALSSAPVQKSRPKHYFQAAEVGHSVSLRIASNRLPVVHGASWCVEEKGAQLRQAAHL